MRISITHNNAKLRHFFKLSSCTSLLFTVLFLSSCKKEEKETNQELKTFPLSESITNNENEDLMEFAPATTNPYTTQNMLAALNELKLSDEINCDINKFNIRVTHKYIRFEPQDSLENNTLKADTTLILFDYPLDRKITKGGTYYKDPSLSENEFNFQWCSVPANKSLPINVHYTVLAELYLPEEDAELVQYYETEFDDCITKLVEYALKRTDNFDTTTYDENLTQSEETELKRKTNNKYTPKGNIKVQEDRLNTNLNLDGVKVRAHRWFETRECLTDNNGNFNMLHQFRHPVDYSIKWERGHYTIMRGNLGQSYFNGPHQKSDWNLVITRSSSGGSSWLYAHVHRAANRYFYKNINGLRRPGNRNFCYWVIDNASNGGTLGVNYSEFCRIFGKRTSGGNYYWSDEIFSTTIHETAHSTHIILMKAGLIQFGQVSEMIRESYPIAVEWVITGIEYQGLGIGNYGLNNYNPNITPRLIYPNQLAYQYWRNGINSNTYTPLFIDLIDNFNQNGVNYGTTLLPIIANVNDAVNGYNLRDIENRLHKVYGLSTLNTELKGNIRPQGVTDAQIDNLINLY